MRESDIKIRVDENLKKRFFAACSVEDITASQRLRQMMREWVSEMEQIGAIEKQESEENRWSEYWYRRVGL